MNKKILKNSLKSRLKLIWQHLNSKEIDDIAEKIILYSKSNNLTVNEVCDIKQFISFSIYYIKLNIETRKGFEDKLESAKNRYFQTNDKKEQNKILLEYSKGIVKTTLSQKIKPKNILKTLDFEALTENYNKKIQIFNKKNLAVCRLLKGYSNDVHELPSFLQEQSEDFFNLVFSELGNNLPDLVKTEFLDTIYKLLRIKEEKNKTLKKYSKQINELLNNKYTWLQTTLLRILLLDSENHFDILKQFLNSDNCNDIFVRENAVRYFLKNLQQLKLNDKKISDTLNEIINDKAPFVRQALALNAHILNDESYHKIFEYFMFKEEEVSVKCSALRIYTLEIENKNRLEFVFSNILKSLNLNISNSNYIKYTLHTVDKLIENTHDYKWANSFIKIIDTIRINKEVDIPTKRFAANIKEKLWCYSNNKPYALFVKITDRIAVNKTKKVIKFSPQEFVGYSDETIGRVLSIIAQNNFSLDLSKGHFSHKLYINSTFCFRWWRFLYELFSPSPEKRQTIKHTTGRLFKGTIRASSGIMAEQSETKIPGEPLFINEEGSSRPYLPLLDEFISISEYGKQVKLYSSEGVTSIDPPKGFIKRFIAEFKIAVKFKKIAKLRNWQAEASQESPSAYIEAVRKLGFSIQLIPFDKSNHTAIDKDVSKFFLPAIIPIGLSHYLNSLKIYFLSLYENTVMQLVAFVILLFLFVTGRHYYFNILIRKARKSIPLVIGGWGTRGKSGTERIKAALFSALGCNVVSKTTGCEAMFLYTPCFGKTHELFLFRPYDKATIWEQFNLLRTASKLDADVFLWECMALSPPYVKVLQNDWMRDDYSTITNTYPDHEDLQGPAGWNIAQTMTNFIPKNSVLFTSEEQMFPILEVGAVEKNTEFQTIDKFNTILLTPDILERFPYEEHPYNITLVLRMAHHLGITKQFALKEMADNVVPDIGVLKRYKKSTVNNRNLEFFSGMSANERFGCMSNWERMNFDKFNFDENPEIFVATVVNNRADRIARSKVFAQILVEDISVDKHFLIGNNLEGLGGYIKEAWDARMSTFSLTSQASEQEKQTPLEIYTKFSSKLRIPTSEIQIKNILKALLDKFDKTETLINHWNNISELEKSLKIDNSNVKTDLLKYYKNKLDEYNTFLQFAGKLNSSVNQSLENDCKAFFWKVFKAKLVMVNNYYAAGNQVIKVIADNTPPELQVKIMALQNIKGTGLDFFYRWQAWENFDTLCDAITSDDENNVEGALTNIAAFKNLDILWLDKLSKSLEVLRNKDFYKDNIKVLAEKVSEKLNSTNMDSYKTVNKDESSKLKKFLFNSLENFLDPGDAIKRRKNTDKIYRQLTAGRISCTKAIKELQDTTKRQKGGWLKLRKK